MPFLPGSQPPGARAQTFTGIPGPPGPSAPEATSTTKGTVLLGAPGGAATFESAAKPAVFRPLTGKVTQILSVGHSYQEGSYLADPATERPDAQLAAMLDGVTCRSIAKGGTDLQSPEPSSGGWGRIMSELTKASGETQPGVVSVMSGINGISATNNWSQTSGNGSGGAHTLRFALSYLRAKPGTVRKLASGSGITLGSGWSAGAASDVTGGQTPVVAAEGTTGTVTDQIPASFDGGVHTIAFLAAAGYAATYSVTVDGQAAGSITLGTGVSATTYTPVALRLGNLAPGAHTVVITPSAITGFALALAVWDEDPAPPLVLLSNQFLPSAYTPYTGSAHVPTDAEVIAMNATQATIAAEFDGDVAIVDTRPLLDRKRSLLSPVDGLHPLVDANRLLALARRRVLLSRP